MCISHMSGAYGGQERVLESLELELQTVVSHYVGAGNRSMEPSFQPLVVWFIKKSIWLTEKSEVLKMAPLSMKNSLSI